MSSLSGVSEIFVGTGISSSCLCNQEAVLWILDALGVVEGSGEVMDRVRNRTSSRISAAAALRSSTSWICWKEFGDVISGHFNPSA